jgi:hypothetical protein
MRKSFLLLAASLATALVLVGVDRTAVAQGGMGGTMSKSKAAKPKAAKRRGFLPGARGKKGPGQCGTFMYWKGGKCVDARLPKK